jgi:hypothetical protein
MTEAAKAMPPDTEAHIMLPLFLEVADQLVDGGWQVILGVYGNAVFADLEVQVWAAGPPGLQLPVRFLSGSPGRAGGFRVLAKPPAGRRHSPPARSSS